MSVYRPIACADHERLEFAALTRQWLTLEILPGDDGHLGVTRLLPRDVRTRDGAEWLYARLPDDSDVILRLDRLRF